MSIKKYILSFLFLVQFLFALANPPSCFEILANDFTNTRTTQAFKDFVKQPEGFLAFQKLSDKTYDLRTNLDLLNFSKKLESQPATFSKILSEVSDAEIIDFAKGFQNSSLTDLAKFDADNTLFSVWKSFKPSNLSSVSDAIKINLLRNDLSILEELSKINKSLGQNALELEVLKKMEVYDNTTSSEILFYFQNINKALNITPKPKQLIYLAIPEVRQSGSVSVGFKINAGKFEFDDIDDLLDLQDIKDELLYFKDDKFIGGVFDFVIDYKGNLKIGNAHSSLAGTAPVQAVGEILIKDGKILEFCNASGHIKPELLKATIYKELLNDKLLDVQDVKEVLIDFSDIESAITLNSQKNTRWQSIIDGWKLNEVGKAWKWLPDGAINSVDDLVLGTGSTIKYNATKFTGLSFDNQVKLLTENVSGLTKEQAEFIVSFVKSRNGKVVFGGSRVRGNAKITNDWSTSSDLDLGFDGLSSGQRNSLINDFNKKFAGSSQNKIIEHNWIYPNSTPSNIPTILTPEEFFMRSGIRSSYEGGLDFGPSGFISIDFNGNVILGKQ